MPCTPEAVDVLRKANVLVAPSMAAGVGGVCFFLIITSFNFKFFQYLKKAFYCLSPHVNTESCHSISTLFFLTILRSNNI